MDTVTRHLTEGVNIFDGGAFEIAKEAESQDDSIIEMVLVEIPGRERKSRSLKAPPVVGGFLSAFAVGRRPK